MTTTELLLYGQAAASLLMLIGWLVALKIKNTSYVDVLWAYGVGVLGFAYLYLEKETADSGRLLVLQVFGGPLVASSRNLFAFALPGKTGGCPLCLPSRIHGNASQCRIFRLLPSASLLGRAFRLSLFNPRL